MCFSLENVCNKYFTNTCCLGLADRLSMSAMYAAMWGQCQSASEKRKSESAVQTHCGGQAKKKVEYLLWAAWFSVLAFWIKVGRLKHFPGISWWSHYGYNLGCQTSLCTRPDRGKDALFPSLASINCPLCKKPNWWKKEDVNNMPGLWNGQCLMVLYVFLFLPIYWCSGMQLSFPLQPPSKLTKTSTNYCPLVGLFIVKWMLRH